MTIFIKYLRSILGYPSKYKSSKGANFLEYPASYRVKILKAAAREAKKSQDNLLARYEAKFGSR